MGEIILTEAKFNEMTARLAYLETEGREDIAQRIKTAKEFGDLSENAEYSAAREAQSKMETEILELTETLHLATVIAESSIKTSKVGLGNKVKVQRLSDGKEADYLIVSSAEANSLENKLSDQSPIGKAVIGKKRDDVVTAMTPRGPVEYKIIKISK